MVGQEKNLPKKAIFGTFYRDLCRILFASVLCFCAGIFGAHAAGTITLSNHPNNYYHPPVSHPYANLSFGTGSCLLPDSTPIDNCDTPVIADCGGGYDFLGYVYYDSNTGEEIPFIDFNGCLTTDGQTFCQEGSEDITIYAMCKSNVLRIRNYIFAVPTQVFTYDAGGFYLTIWNTSSAYIGQQTSISCPSAVTNPVALNFLGYFNYDGTAQYVDGNCDLTPDGQNAISNSTGALDWFGMWENANDPNASYTLTYDCGTVPDQNVCNVVGPTGSPQASHSVAYGQPYTISYGYGQCQLNGYQYKGLECSNGLMTTQNWAGYYSSAGSLNPWLNSSYFYYLWDIKDDSTCTVQWEPVSCEFNYSCGAGSGTPIPSTGSITFAAPYTLADGTGCTPPSPPDATSMYIFDGWDCDWDNSGNAIMSGTWCSLQGNSCSLKTSYCYANWQVSKGYTVEYSCNNGGLGTEPADNNLYLPQGNHTATAAANTCLPPMGKFFSGWNCGSSIGVVNPGSTFSVENFITCTAVWTDIDACDPVQEVTWSWLDGWPQTENITIDWTDSGTINGNYVSFNDGYDVYVGGMCDQDAGSVAGEVAGRNLLGFGGGENCWCYASDYGLSNLFNSVYVFAQSYANENQCESNCTNLCVQKLHDDVIFRRNLYMSAQCDDVFYPVTYSPGDHGVLTTGTGIFSGEMTPSYDYILRTLGNDPINNYHSGITAQFGYNFTGWRESVSGQTFAENGVVDVSYITGPLTFVAQWEQTHSPITVNYSCGSGSGSPSSATVTYNNSYTFLGNNACSPGTGYSGYNTWSCTDNNSNSHSYAAGSSQNLWGLNNVTTLNCSPVWIPTKYYVTYYGGSCSGNNVSYRDDDNFAVYGGTYNLINEPDNLGTHLDKECAKFLGWSETDSQNNSVTTATYYCLDDHGNTLPYGFGFDYCDPYESNLTISPYPAQNTKLYAVCVPRTYNVIYHYNNCLGSNDPNYNLTYPDTNGLTYNVPYNILGLVNGGRRPFSIGLPSVPQGIAHFDGWAWSANATTPDFTASNATYTYNPDGVCSAGESLDLYAVCSTIPTYTVSYSCGSGNDIGGSAPTDSNSPYTQEQTVTVLGNTGNCSKTGNTFVGWICDNSIGAKTAGQTFTMPAADVECEANYVPNTIYLTWLANGGTMSPNPPMCTFGVSAGDEGSITPISDPTRDGYTFSGWTISHGLPSGYTQLQYISATGNQYIDTEIQLASTDVIEATFRNSATTPMALYGVYNPTAGQSSAFYANETYYAYDATNTKVDTHVDVDTNNWHTVVHNFANGRLSLDDTTVQFAPFTSFSNNVNNRLFQRKNNSGYGYNFIGDVKSYKIFRNGSVILNFVPAERNADNAVGMFDTVTGMFFTSGSVDGFSGS